MAVDLVIDIENEPGALSRVAAAISDAGVNIAAATCVGPARRAQLHVLAISGLIATHEREVVVVEVQDRPGELADLAAKVAGAGINLDLLYVATRSRVVLGSDDLDGLRLALGDHVDGNPLA